MFRAVLGAALLVPCLGWGADNDPDTFTDPRLAGPDYEVQGEYLGETTSGEKLGAHVIALGEGKFNLVGYEGGLPGAGWSRDGNTVRGSGQRKNGDIEIKVGETVATLADGAIVVRFTSGGEHARLKKVVRKSPTLGAKPPEGAIVLFDGTSAERFKNGKLVEQRLLLADCESIEQLGDHTLHLEFRTPFKPKATGQARGNSGVYIQSRYEVQVLDSFGLDGKNNECGGIYSIAEPQVNMCFPPLTWQTYDMEFKAARYSGAKKVTPARVTIRHNGVVIHDDLELPKGTPGRSEEGPGPAPLYLQGHGNPVVFQNIWVVKTGE